MYRCDLCNTIVQKRNKTKHNRSKKHKYYSNLILNRYVIRSVEVNKFKDVFNSYFIEHTRNFNLFSVNIIIRIYDGDRLISHKTGLLNYVTYKIQSEHFTTHMIEAANDFLHKVIPSYFYNDIKIIPEIEIVFKSDLEDITGKLYLELPK